MPTGIHVDAGIICLTKDNLNKPWILFEAGALSKNFGKANVCTILFNLDSSDFSGPLTSFQATKFDKADFKKLLTTINNTGGELKLESAVLNEVFEMWWPNLEHKINEILRTHVVSNDNAIRSEREILEEVLELTRLNSKRIPRRNENTRESVIVLIELMQQMQYRTIKNGNKESLMFFDEIRRPLKRLCIDLDMPEMYDRFMIRNDNFIDKNIFENEERRIMRVNDGIDYETENK